MRFPTQEIKLAENATKISASAPFQLAPFYPMGWFKVGEVFELDFSSFDKCILPYEVLSAKRIQFSCLPSHPYVMGEYQDFCIKIMFDTVSYIVGKGPTKTAFFLPGNQYPVFITKAGAEYYKDLLRKNAKIFVSHGAYNHNSESTIESFAYGLGNLIVEFWVNRPGYTDGPEYGASVEEIEKYLLTCRK